MQNLLNFLYRFRTFGFFMLLELFCVWLIVSYNTRPNAAFMNSSNAAVANLIETRYNTTKYLALDSVNQQLLEENRRLRIELSKVNLLKYEVDTTLALKYDFIAANVINNSYERELNYFTINAGKTQGVLPGMGVITHSGIAGQVKSVSNHFSTVASLLHRKMLVSGSVKRTSTLCTVQWDAEDFTQASLKYVPRHIDLQIGDTVVTSGFNSVFPAAVPIGVVTSTALADEDAFYTAKIDLSVDFTSLNYAYVVKSELIAEKDSLEQVTLDAK